jgi:uncharacterized membrane protein YphA (DoxX/SURF4 family)
MGVVILIARILYAMIFIGSGSAGHLMQTEGTAGYAESRGVPNSKILTQLSGVVIFVGGLGVILGIWADLAALGLAAYSLIAGIMVHHFWTDEDAMTQQVEMSMFMKNLSIAGGGLALFGFLAATGDAVGLMITDPLFDLDF